MNSKLCKRLRRTAETRTVGKPVRRWLRMRNGMIINDPNSTRGVYRALKREHRKAIRQC